jgi:hypothetical protein
VRGPSHPSTVLAGRSTGWWRWIVDDETVGATRSQVVEQIVTARFRGLTVGVRVTLADYTSGHLLSRYTRCSSVPVGYSEIGSEGESLTTPSESVVSGPRP